MKDMGEFSAFDKYDEVLTSILVNEKSILGFLSAVFGFLSRRTDFYYVPEGPHENMGFPPGVAEELVLKVLRKCDPKSWPSSNNDDQFADINNEIMCSTVAQEVEIGPEEGQNTNIEEAIEKCDLNAKPKNKAKPEINSDRNVIPDDYEPPKLPTQKNSESYNGAVTDNYSWSQTIMDLDVTVKLPQDIKTSKEVKVVINPSDIFVAAKGNVLMQDSLPYKVMTIESFWSLSEGKLLIHLEKLQERWWNKLLDKEEPIDLARIDCSRPLDELPDDHIAKVQELQWNQEQKYKGLPTSDEIRNIEVLKKAWNADGSPFKGKEFDPNVLYKP